MKNGFDLINTVRAWCYANHCLMTQVHYSLRGQYAVFVAESLTDKKYDNRYSVLRWTEQNGVEVCKWNYFKSDALHLMIDRFDDMQGGSQ